MLKRSALALVAISLLAGSGLASPGAFAQAVTPAEPAAPAAATRAPGESVADFIGRALQESPSSLSERVTAMLSASPEALGEVVTFVNSQPDNVAASGVLAGLSAWASGSIVPFTSAVASLVAADAGNVSAVIQVARTANSRVLSAAFGEGLALASVAAKNAGNAALAASIQTQATAATAPVPLSEAFLDAALETAAGAGAGAGGAGGGGGDIGNGGGTTLAGGFGTQSAGVSQSGSSTSAPSGGGNSISILSGDQAGTSVVSPGENAGI